MKSITNRDFKYTSAADSAKPGYLRKRFAAILKQQREQAERPTAAVISPASFMLRRGGK